jgi:hypothetical protein
MTVDASGQASSCYGSEGWGIALALVGVALARRRAKPATGLRG